MKHLLVRHVNGNPHDVRLYDALVSVGTWSVRTVRRDDHGRYVTLDGKRYYIDDPDLFLKYLD